MRKSIKRFAATGAAAALISGGMVAGAGTAFAQDTEAETLAPDSGIGELITGFLCEFDFAGSLAFCEPEAPEEDEATVDEAEDDVTADDAETEDETAEA